jgi:hypothetical protein
MDKKELLEKLAEMAKKRGLSIAEESLEALAHVVLDGGKLLVEETENDIDNMVYASLESKLRKMIDEIDLDGDGE